MNGEWIWIILALFGIFRLLALAGKKPSGRQSPPASPSRGGAPSEPEGEVDELKAFIDSLSARVGAEPRTRPPQSPRDWSANFPAPAPPRPRREVRAPRRPAPPRLETIPPPSRRPPPPPTVIPSRPSKNFFSFPMHPVVQGIIFSEILGSPRGLAHGSDLPSDPDNFF